MGFNSRFYYEGFGGSLEQFLFDLREHGQKIDLNLQLNGLSQGIELAAMLDDPAQLPVLDESYPYSVVKQGGGFPRAKCCPFEDGTSSALGG